MWDHLWRGEPTALDSSQTVELQWSYHQTLTKGCVAFMSVSECLLYSEYLHLHNFKRLLACAKVNCCSASSIAWCLWLSCEYSYFVYLLRTTILGTFILPPVLNVKKLVTLGGARPWNSTNEWWETSYKCISYTLVVMIMHVLIHVHACLCTGRKTLYTQYATAPSFKQGDPRITSFITKAICCSTLHHLTLLLTPLCQ